MVRKFVTLDGEVLAEEEWKPNAHPENRCFWCNNHLISSETYSCSRSFDGNHDWVTVCDKEFV
jgi:hypothetical protein